MILIIKILFCLNYSSDTFRERLPDKVNVTFSWNSSLLIDSIANIGSILLSVKHQWFFLDPIALWYFLFGS